MKMSISSKVLEIYEKYYVCPYCLGRMWALLGTNTTNLERGTSLLLSLTLEGHKSLLSGSDSKEKEGLNILKILAEKAVFVPAQKVLEKEGYKYSLNQSDPSCYLCQGIFDNLEKYAEKGREVSKDIEFDNFLVGTSPDSQIINQEDIFKAEYTLLEAESFKSHFNREVGKNLMKKLDKEPNFEEPDLLFLYNLNYEDFKIDLILKPVFIYGRYNKFLRGIPQTHWYCRKCQGKGCELCDFTGKKYETSVEELISPEFVKLFEATDSKFHGAGREDIDVKMLGSGRPFILELTSPKKRRTRIDLKKIQEKVNTVNDGKIKIQDLRFSDKNEVIAVKSDAETTQKVYEALVEAEQNIEEDVFNEKLIQLKKTLEDQTISQRTPIRVSHRRSDKIREKKIYRIEGIYIQPNLFRFTIETQGGTYIKELIHGDEGRTSPSFAEMFNFPLACKELNVVEIKF